VAYITYQSDAQLSVTPLGTDSLRGAEYKGLIEVLGKTKPDDAVALVSVEPAAERRMHLPRSVQDATDKEIVAAHGRCCLPVNNLGKLAQRFGSYHSLDCCQQVVTSLRVTQYVRAILFGNRVHLVSHCCSRTHRMAMTQ
jgi:hypothetical protein